MPPAYLRPRRLTDTLHVCPIASVESVSFDSARQRLTAVLRDAEGGEALLLHPFHTRGRQGFEALAATLADRPAAVRFVCGHFASIAGSLTMEPIMVVVNEGGRRVGLQPWIAAVPSDASSRLPREVAQTDGHSPLEAFLIDLRFELSELLLAGLGRWNSRTAAGWSRLAEQGQRVGFVKLVEPLLRLLELAAGKTEVVSWDAVPAAKVALDMCLSARVLSDIVR